MSPENSCIVEVQDQHGDLRLQQQPMKKCCRCERGGSEDCPYIKVVIAACDLQCSLRSICRGRSAFEDTAVCANYSFLHCISFYLIVYIIFPLRHILVSSLLFYCTSFLFTSCSVCFLLYFNYFSCYCLLLHFVPPSI